MFYFRMWNKWFPSNWPATAFLIKYFSVCCFFSFLLFWKCFVFPLCFLKREHSLLKLVSCALCAGGSWWITYSFFNIKLCVSIRQNFIYVIFNITIDMIWLWKNLFCMSFCIDFYIVKKLLYRKKTWI